MHFKGGVLELWVVVAIILIRVGGKGRKGIIGVTRGNSITLLQVCFERGEIKLLLYLFNTSFL